MSPPAAARPLSEVLGALEAKGLRRGIGPMPGSPTPPAVTSGQPELDAALGTGGWPRGALAAIEAPIGSGAASLALGSLAACQRSGGLVAWIDLDGSFDPATAARTQIDLEGLLLVRPADAAEALELAAWLARSRLVDLVALDVRRQTHGAGLPRGLDRLGQLLARGEAVTLLLGGPTPCQAAGVRVSLQRLAWLAVGHDLVGQRVAVTVARQRWALAGGRVELDLWFAEGRRIDPLLPSLAEPRAVEGAARPALRVLTA